MADIKGSGMKFYLGDAAESLTEVARITNLKPGKIEAPTQEATPLTAEGEEWVGGLPDYGEVTLRLRLDIAAHSTAIRNKIGQDIFGKVEYPISPTAKLDTFAGVVKSYEEDDVTTKTGAIMATAVVKISGKVTRADAT